MAVDMRAMYLRLAVFSVLLLLPACVAVLRDTYAEAHYLGATTFLSYIDKAGLTKLLKDPRENLTVFAPTNVAFSQFPPNLISKLNTNDTFTKEVLSFHVCQGVEDTHTNNLLCPTLDKYNARVNVYTNPNVTTISGSPVLLDGNKASNGQVVIVRKVMYPLPTGSALTYVSGDNFNMLLLALSKAGVTSLLSGPNITVLAPTNQAFQSLPPGVFSDLLNNVPLLTKVLKNHLVNEVVYSAYLVDKGGAVLTSADGQKLHVRVSGKNNSTLHIGKATVTAPDQTVSNGVVHVINKVLLPA